VLYGLVVLLVIWLTKGPVVDEIEDVVGVAAREAERQGLGCVGAGHLLVAVLENLEGAAADVLKAHAIEPDQARPAMAESPEEAAGFGDALQDAIRLARRFRDEAVGSGHLLLGLLADPTPAVRRALDTAQIDAKNLRDELYEEMRPD
jgi:ATP-dependent Clp protease ATP-binding subunit ClpA